MCNEDVKPVWEIPYTVAERYSVELDQTQISYIWAALRQYSALLDPTRVPAVQVEIDNLVALFLDADSSVVEGVNREMVEAIKAAKNSR